MAGGRQREFNKLNALDSAVQVFWKKGYLGASLADLTSEMGINKPSLYATFGNKEELFVQATEHYLEHYAVTHAQYLNQEGIGLIERLKAFMLSSLKAQCDSSSPKGCYISLCVSETAGGAMPPVALTAIEKARDFSEEFLARFFSQEIAIGHILENHTPGDLALYVVTILHGTASMARGGKELVELEGVIDKALQSFVDLIVE